MRRVLWAVCLVLVSGCAATAPPAGLPAAAPSDVTFTILHFNDVYEITPVEGGRSGGLARVAGLRQQLLADDPHTITVIAGDFFSPSALGTARVDGARLNGRQMVAVLNAVGVDVAALGNHEFDVSEADFRARLAESRFPYVSANVAPAAGAAAFPNVSPGLLMPVVLAPGDTLRVAFVSAVISSTLKPFVVYSDPVPALADETARLAPRADVVVALTHLAFADDATVAATVPGLDMVLGGHEHENVRAYRGPRLVPVLKADANARTVYVHRVTVHRGMPRGAAGRVEVASELVGITDALPDDPAVAAEVRRWTEAGYAGFRADGFEPTRVVTVTSEDLDGRESTVRTRPAPLGQIIAEGFRVAPTATGAAPAEAGLFNGGSVRVDDVLPAGPFTELDAIRVLPFGGEVVTVRMSGALLARVLAQGEANAGTGGFLQTAGIARTPAGWTVAGAPLDPARTYTVATSDFLVSGRETGLDYFNAETNPEVVIVGRHGDVRRALINQLTRLYGAPR
ncbi:MAG TPA: bifunctional metallophosphatase/5'-nucleotidase [Rubricoccaceae bacterium]|jgi:5'-nucleotidase